MKRGKFIVIDGGEGTGKGTLIERLRDNLDGAVAVTREPGGTPKAEKIRDFLLHDPKGKELTPREQFDLLWEARKDHVDNLILPYLKAGTHVICDRFDSSTWAYQIKAFEQPALKRAFWRHRNEVLHNCEPDIYVVLNVLPEVGLERVAQRGDRRTHFDDQKIEFHERVRGGLQDFVCSVIKKGICARSVDAHPPPSEVYEKVRGIIRENLHI